MDTNSICNLQTGICEENQNFYSMCRPTLFPLRFIGGPPGLWRLRLVCNQPRNYRRVCAIIMLIALNLGAVGELCFSINIARNPNYTFGQNMNMFFVLAISVSGTIGLNMLWWKRSQLKELLDSIDFEPKMCAITDAKCQRTNEREIRNKTIKMFIFMILFSTYTSTIYSMSWKKSKDRFVDATSLEFHASCWLFTLGFLSIYPFAIILSFYISLSWIFRLKIKRMIKYIQQDIELAHDGKLPSAIHAKCIELWFSLYKAQFKKYNFIFKQIAGIIYVVIVWSVLSYVENSINILLTQKWAQYEPWDMIHEYISVAVLIYFLYSLSSVEYCMKRFVKLLYRLSLKIKFIDPSHTLSNTLALDLSEKYQLLGETVHKSGLNISLFGLMHVSRSLIITTFSIVTTYGLLMYELFGDHKKSTQNCANSSTTLDPAANQSYFSL